MAASSARTVGNYRLYEELGSGGMGTVHLGRLFATGGFRRIVAIKRLHPHLAQNIDFVSGFLDEARLASRIHHPNVISPLDVVAEGGEVFLVFEFMLGVSLSMLARAAAAKGEPMPTRIAVTLVVDMLNGLHAAHEATGDDGEALGLIHRDVSPQNVLVGSNGTAFLLDFGIAKAAGRAQTTDEGVIKGKRGYMAPEHLLGQSCRASDLYSAAVVLWELLVQRRLFPDETTLAARLSGAPIDWPDAERVAEPLRGAVLRALDPDPTKRFATARDMSHALEAAGLATVREVGDWVNRIAENELAERARLVARAESAVEVPAPVKALPAAVDGGVTEIAVVHSAVTEILARAVDPMKTTPRAPSRRRGAVVLVTVVAAVFVIALVVVLVVRRARSADLATTAAASAAAAASSLALAPPEAASALPSNAPSPAASDSASPPAAARLHDPGASGPASAKPRAASGARGARTNAPCKPYIVDKNGRTQFNEECLDKGR